MKNQCTALVIGFRKLVWIDFVFVLLLLMQDKYFMLCDVLVGISRKTKGTVWDLGSTLFSPHQTIEAAHTNYFHTNSPPTLIGLFSVHMYRNTIACLSHGKRIFFFGKIRFASQKIEFLNFHFLAKKSVKMTLNGLETTKYYKN